MEELEFDIQVDQSKTPLSFTLNFVPIIENIGRGDLDFWIDSILLQADY